MTQRNRTLLYIAGILIIMMSSTFIFPRYGRNTNKKVDTENNQQEISQEKLPTVGEEIIQENQSQYTIYIEKPIIIDLKDSQKQEAANLFITQSINNLIDDFKKDLPEETTETIQSSLEGEYEIIFFSDSLFSIRINYSRYLSGAIDLTIQSKVLNYDIENSKELTLENIFNQESDYLSFIATTASQQLNSAYSSSDEDITNWIKSATSSEKENFSDFVFNKQEILIQFSSDQIGSMIAGADEVKIPASDLMQYMSDSSLKTLWEEI
ncbi:MAG: DUF4163 domain-containing protein [Candidatus Pacebacteria bacterium]|nr:DUF4163 domain-containing protein [Candidatus Paceibacterota bacterium]